ncbi:MAG: DUF1874 domain-containing protein [Myxococcota bacterium]
MTFLCNAFSLNMLGPATAADLQVRRIELGDARALAVDARSAVGHAETATVLADLLGRPVETARVTLELAPGDSVLVGQYIGPRLIEGAVSLPIGARVDWFHVSWPAPPQ